jgi:putative hemolysin
MKTMSPVAVPTVVGRRAAPGFKLMLTAGVFVYAARLASSSADVRAAQALRTSVFKGERTESLEASRETHSDVDGFDAAFDHLVVEELKSGTIVGASHFHISRQAAAHLGFDSARKFDLSPFESLPEGFVELGQICVAPSHRNLFVLQLVRRSVAFYAQTHGARYLISCSSLDSQAPREGAALYSCLLRRHAAPALLQTRPLPGWVCPLEQIAEEPPRVPELLGTYLAMGAVICSPPAIDRESKTIDFLTLLDLAE